MCLWTRWVSLFSLSVDIETCFAQTWRFALRQCLLLCWVTCAQLCIQLFQTLWTTRLLCPWNFPGKNAGVGCHFLHLGIFPTHESNPSLLHWLHWQVESLSLAPPGKSAEGSSSQRAFPTSMLTPHIFLPFPFVRIGSGIPWRHCWFSSRPWQ